MNKPTALSHAIIAIWVTLGLAVLSSVVSRLSGSIASDVFIGNQVGFALCAIIPYKISGGRNWARYFYAVLSASGAAMMLAGEYQGSSSLDVALSWILLPVDVWILYSLFRKDSSEWFKHMKSACAS
jgi:hypothetical protein